jgi:hypothetical protein
MVFLLLVGLSICLGHAKEVIVEMKAIINEIVAK